MKWNISRSGPLAMGLAVALLAMGCAGGDGDAASDGPAPGEDLVLEGELVASQELWDAAREEGGLVTYISLAQEVTDNLNAAFAEDTGIEAELINAPTGRLHERILTEVGADQFPGDLIMMPDIAIREEYVEMDLMEPHTVETWDQIPDEYKHEDGLWYSPVVGAAPMAYNTELLSADEAPTAWQDLTDERFRGLYGTVPVTQGANGWLSAMFQRQEFGESFWAELEANDPRFYGSVGAVGDEIARGEVAVGLGRPPVVRDRLEQGAPLEFIWPEDGVPFFNFHAWVVPDSANPNSARLYLNWLLSERAQTVIAEESGDFPVHENAPPPMVQGEPLPSLSELNVWLPDPDDWVSLRDEWIAEWNELYEQ